MYKYEYETINCELGGWGLALAIYTKLKITARS